MPEVNDVFINCYVTTLPNLHTFYLLLPNFLSHYWFCKFFPGSDLISIVCITTNILSKLLILYLCHYSKWALFITNIFFLYFHCKLTINKFLQFTYSCAPRLSTSAPTFSEPSMIFLRQQEQSLFKLFLCWLQAVLRYMFQFIPI